MRHPSLLWIPLLLASLLAAATALELPDVRNYATVETAIKATPRPQTTRTADQPGYIGVELGTKGSGGWPVRAVALDSPAAAAGIRIGDVLLEFDRKAIKSPGQFRDDVQARGAGSSVPLSLRRDSKTQLLQLTLGSPSRPLRLAEQRGILGIQVSSLDDGEGLKISSITKDLPAAKAGLKVGDILLKIDGASLLASSSLTDALSIHEAGDTVSVVYRRGDVEQKFQTQLAPAPAPEGEQPYAARRVWKQPRYRLAVIGVEFADTPHNLKVTAPDWNRLFFSTNVLDAATNATGQITHGSVNDYYREVSCNQFSFEGKVFDWVKLPKSRADYSQGTASRRSRSEFFKEVLDKLLAREPKGALTGFDGLTIIYAGDRFATANRGTLFWPHRSSTTYEGKNWSYVICPEGGSRMANISVFCHEFGHILGLPDLYARAENPGSEGVGAWCAMSNQAGEGRPQHFSVWCKEQLGWLRPATIDPSVRQKLLLSPIESTTNQCYKILIRPDGSEYFLLENRQKRGFDRSLAATGLLIWRVVGNRLILEESHGVEGPAGPRVFPGSVPYPSGANDSFTPFTVPSSRPQLAGGTAIHLQQIRQHPDGRISFEIGTEFQ